MEETLLNVQELACKVGCSMQTIGAYYKYKAENPGSELALRLPEYVRLGNRKTRYWKESDVEAIVRFRSELPQGRNGALGSVTQRYVRGATKHAKENLAHRKKGKRSLPVAYIGRVADILTDSGVEPEVVEQVRELLQSELDWRQALQSA